MSLSHSSATLLEKLAFDNGFDLERPSLGDWLSFASSQTNLKIWLSATGDSQYVLALVRRDVYEALGEFGLPFTLQVPQETAAAIFVNSNEKFHWLLRRAFQLSRALPDNPLQDFLNQTSSLPRSTEAERLVIQRVGQDIFRNGLLDYWEGSCSITGLAVNELLRASHIKPWSACGEDSERLDVFNGLLLAPHLDAAFDRGYLTIDLDGGVMISVSLDSTSRLLLGISSSMKLRRITDRHRFFLDWHREHIFKYA